jgi:hypothetical protein
LSGAYKGALQMTNKKMREFIEEYDASYATSGKNKEELTEMYNEVLTRMEADTAPIETVEEDLFLKAPVEIVAEEETNSLVGQTFNKTITNPLIIDNVYIGESITITEKHLAKKNFERIFKGQVNKGILKRA